MNKYLLYISILITSYLPIVSGYAAEVTINISAKVVASTCTISSASRDFILSMHSASAKGVPINTPFGQQNLAIFIENCPDETTAHVSFSGISDSVSPNLIQIEDSDISAKGIALGLYTRKTQENLDIRNNKTDFLITKNDLGSKGLEFTVAYIKTSIEKYSPGKVVAVASFEITYD